MHVMHQALPAIKAMPTRELLVYARLAAAISGAKFE